MVENHLGMWVKSEKNQCCSRCEDILRQYILRAVQAIDIKDANRVENMWDYIRMLEYKNTRISEYIRCVIIILSRMQLISRMIPELQDRYVRIYQNTRIPENLNISHYINVTIYCVNVLSHQQLHHGCWQSWKSLYRKNKTLRR